MNTCIGICIRTHYSYIMATLWLHHGYIRTTTGNLLAGWYGRLLGVVIERRARPSVSIRLSAQSGQRDFAYLKVCLSTQSSTPSSIQTLYPKFYPNALSKVLFEPLPKALSKCSICPERSVTGSPSKRRSWGAYWPVYRYDLRLWSSDSQVQSDTSTGIRCVSIEDVCCNLFEHTNHATHSLHRQCHTNQIRSNPSDRQVRARFVQISTAAHTRPSLMRSAMRSLHKAPKGSLSLSSTLHTQSRF